MKISVITVSYNAVRTIEDTICSVIDQTYANIEYIIIDGGSTDGTIDIIKRYAEGGSEEGKHNHRITKWISEPDHGIYDAMNKGIALATGDYINFMNAGDSFVSEYTIQDFVNVCENDSIIVYGDTLMKTGKGMKLCKALPVENIKTKGILCHQSVFIQAIFHKNHNYDLKYKVLADFNFFFTSYNIHKVKYQQIKTSVAVFDMTDDGLSKRDYHRNYDELIEIIKPNVSNAYILMLRCKEVFGRVKRLLIK